MSNHEAHMTQVRRERETESEVRSLDADDIVRWIHRLEDEVGELESLLRQAEEALTFDWSGEPYNSRPLIDRIRKALEPPR